MFFSNLQVHYNVAKVHADLGNSSVAISEYTTAIKCAFRVSRPLHSFKQIFVPSQFKSEVRPRHEQPRKYLQRSKSLRGGWRAAASSYCVAVLSKMHDSFVSVLECTEWFFTEFLGCCSRPDFAAAWMNLGIVQTALKKHSSAKRSYLTALTHRKRYPDCYYNLGNLASWITTCAVISCTWNNAIYESGRYHGISSIGFRLRQLYKYYK